MDLISRISQHFSDSAQVKLEAVEMLAAPIAQAALLCPYPPAHRPLNSL